MGRLLFLSLVGLAMTSISLAEDAPKESDLQGVWIAAAAESGGKAIPKERLDNLKLRQVFAGGQYLGVLDTTITEEGTYKVDTTKKPWAIDITLPDKDGKTKTQLGIVEVKGAEVKLCVAPYGQTERPTAFASKAGSEHQFFTLKRDKR